MNTGNKMPDEPHTPLHSPPHTPLPWKFSPWHIEEASPAVRAPAGHIVATTASDEDAELIVCSVNSLPSLVAALQDCIDILDRAESGFIPGCGSDLAWKEGRDNRVRSARAALAEYRGGGK